MIADPSRTTVVAWYDTLPDGLALLVDRVQAAADRLLGDAFTARDPEQVHATLIGLERAAAPFDPAPLAGAPARGAVAAVDDPVRRLRRPTTVDYLSRGLSLHDRGFGVYGTKAVLVGWPVVGDTPTRALAELRLSCAALGVIHRYGDDPDVYMVIGDVAGVPAAARRAGRLPRAGRGGRACAVVRGRPLARHVRRHRAAPRVDVVAPAAALTAHHGRAVASRSAVSRNGAARSGRPSSRMCSPLDTRSRKPHSPIAVRSIPVCSARSRQ